MDLDKNDQVNPDDGDQIEFVSGIHPGPTASKYVFVVKNKAMNLETRYELEDGKEIIVGADPQCSVPVLEDEFLSFRHFSVKLTGDNLEVKDLGSKNGLYLLLDKPEQISAGQTLLAGKTVFNFEKE